MLAQYKAESTEADPYAFDLGNSAWSNSKPSKKKGPSKLKVGSYDVNADIDSGYAASPASSAQPKQETASSPYSDSSSALDRAAMLMDKYKDKPPLYSPTAGQSTRKQKGRRKSFNEDEIDLSLSSDEGDHRSTKRHE